MASALTALANLTLSAAQTTVTFTSISGAYRDLYLVYRGNSDGYSGNAPSMRFNSDSANYLWTSMTGTGSTTVTDTNTSYSWLSLTDANYLGPNQPQTLLMNIFDYAVTDKHKTVLVRSNNPNQGVNALVGRWGNTSAITSITLSIAFSSTNFVAGSTFALYGVSA